MGIGTNLPPIMPGSGGTTPQGYSSFGSSPLGTSGPVRRHAQDFSTGELDQYKERRKATVSIHQAISGKDGNTKSSSIFHAGNNDLRPVSSVAHMGEANVEHAYDGQEYSRDADDRRYDYAQRRNMARKRTEAKAAAVLAKKMAKKGTLQPGTGSQYQASGASGFKKKLAAYVRGNRTSLKNISAEDRKLFEQAVAKHAKGKSAGADWGRKDKASLKSAMKREWKSGNITKGDYQDFSKIIKKF